jgi:hypothetical protein
MDNNTLQIKVKERLNKLGSFDYDNLECWQIAEAFNKAQIEWVRRQIDPTAQSADSDESSKMQIDDIQILLTQLNLTSAKKNRYYETQILPEDYLYFKRISLDAKTDCCPARKMVVFLEEVANVDILLGNEFTKPSAEWGETFCTLQGNRIRIYTNNEFEIEDPNLTFYRRPRTVQFEGCVDLSTGNPITNNVTCEFKDDIAELILESAVAILAGDTEYITQYQRSKAEAQTNE